MTGTNGKVTMYQPQPETFENNILTGRAAISVTPSGKEPVFGAIWFDAKMLTDRESRMVTLESITIKNIRFPDGTDTSKIGKLREILTAEIPKRNLSVSLDRLLASLEEEAKNMKADANLKMEPPKIVYAKTVSILVLIDGEPKLEAVKDQNLERVKNTAFLIVKSTDDKKYYLWAASGWFTSSDLMTGWTRTTNVPKALTQIEGELRKKEKELNKETGDTTPRKMPAVVVSTEPTELIQTDGEPNFAPIQQTNLLYATNTENNIFMDINTQKYYIVLSGRWFTGRNLNGPWEYVESPKLPPDFAKIPEGTDKDVVLPYVAGTKAAEEAVMDAQIPQTAKVDRATAKCNVTYEGEPKFEDVTGTSLKYAVNSSSTVLQDGGKYYCVENAVWFIATSAKGPWTVATERPKQVDDIPPSSSVYNTKYAYIYDVTPTVVYAGYTPGYVGTYVYGPTIVYGTGYYYNPWYGAYYYPRPVTWGFGMYYNPWMGWGMGVSMSYGCFTFHFGMSGWYRPPYYGYGGYWGPHGHYPYHHHHHGGYYGHGHHPYNYNSARNGNMYNNRNGVQSGARPSTQPSGGSRPSAGTLPAGGNRPGAGGPSAGTLPAGGNRPGAGGPSAGTLPAGGNRPSASNPSVGTKPATPSQQPNNVFTDKSGNVYKKDNNGNWSQRSGNSWQSTDRAGNNSGRPSAATNDLNRMSSDRDRGAARTNNFQSSSRPSGGYSGGSRGGGFSGGGRGGGRR
jgi:hypothetical protein